MRRFTAVLLLALVGCTSAVGVGHVSDYSQIRDVTYMLRMLNGTCSAVAVSENQVLTAGHCVNEVVDVSTLLIQDGSDPNGAGILGRGVALKIDQNADLALITVDFKFKTWAKLAKNKPAIDSKAFVVGYPLGIMEFVTIGLIQGYNEDGMFASTNVIFGNSGGPLFVIEDGKYVLAGITSFLASAWGTPITYIAGFVPLSSIDSFLKQ